jgi:hypothetical protein
MYICVAIAAVAIIIALIVSSRAPTSLPANETRVTSKKDERPELKNPFEKPASVRGPSRELISFHSRQPPYDVISTASVKGDLPRMQITFEPPLNIDNYDYKQIVFDCLQSALPGTDPVHVDGGTWILQKTGDYVVVRTHYDSGRRKVESLTVSTKED